MRTFKLADYVWSREGSRIKLETRLPIDIYVKEREWGTFDAYFSEDSEPDCKTLEEAQKWAEKELEHALLGHLEETK